MTPTLMKIDPSLIVIGLIILFSLVGPVIERWLRKKQRDRGEQPQGPEPEEPKLPYEDLVNELFGGYIDRRKKEHAARQAEVEVVEVVEEPAPPPRRTFGHKRLPEPAPAPAAAPEEPAPQVLEVMPSTASVALAPRFSLEEQLFRSRRLSPGAKLVLAHEILDRPRALRRRS